MANNVRRRKSRRKPSAFNVQRSKRMKRKINKKKSNSEVPQSFMEALQSSSKQKSRKVALSKSEISFLQELMKDHGRDFVEMARDKRNYNQLTESELRRKCSQLL